MSQLKPPTQVKFFCSCLWQGEVNIEAILSEQFEITGSLMPAFNPLLEYYQKEMGAGLKRGIFWDGRLFDRERLVPLKLWADAKERCQQPRQVNIDVGYVAKEQLILATGKPYAHRIYLSEGVYAELVYTYSDKTFKSLPWTYPDYQHEEKIHFFNQIR